MTEKYDVKDSDIEELMRKVRILDSGDKEAIKSIGSPRIRKLSLYRKSFDCVNGCENKCPNISKENKFFYEIGIRSELIIDLEYSSHWCDKCNIEFDLDYSHVVHPDMIYSNRAVITSLDLFFVHEKGLEDVVEIMKHNYHVNMPSETLIRWTDNILSKDEYINAKSKENGTEIFEKYLLR